MFSAFIYKSVFIKSKALRNESEVAQILFTISKLQTNYAEKHRGKFAPDFDELIENGNLDEHFNGKNPIVSGYVFSMKVSEPTAQYPPVFSINADPEIPSFNETGEMHFYYDSTLNVIKATEENRPANATDPAI